MASVPWLTHARTEAGQTAAHHLAQAATLNFQQACDALLFLLEYGMHELGALPKRQR